MAGTKTSWVNGWSRCVLAILAVIGVLLGIADTGLPSIAASNIADFIVVAGNAAGSKPSPTGSAASSTSLNEPEDVAVDEAGNPIICDTGDGEIEVLATSNANPGYELGGDTVWKPGNLYVIAGAGTSPSAPTSSGSSALSTQLNSPEGLAVDPEGNVVVADTAGNLVAVIAVSSTNPGYNISSWSRGDIYTIAGDDNTYPAPTYSGSSGNSVGLNSPSGIAIDPEGNVVIADTFASEIAVLAVSVNNPGYEIATNSIWTAGDLYEIAGRGSTSPTYSGVPAQRAVLNGPEGIAISSDGNVIFADEQSNEVDALAVFSNDSGLTSISSWTQGDVYVLAGGGTNSPTMGGVAPDQVSFDAPTSVAIDREGNVVIANMYANEVDVLAEGLTNPGYSVDSTSGWQENSVFQLIGGGSASPNTSGANALSVVLGDPEGVSVSGDGSVVVADTSHSEIERLEIAPSAPLLYSSGSSTNSIALSWSPPVEDGGAPVTAYQIQAFTSSSTPLTNLGTSTSANSVTITGLTSNTTYKFEVEASNAVGMSAPSNEIAVTTDPTPSSSPATPAGVPTPDRTPANSAGKRTQVKVLDADEVASTGFVTLTARCAQRSCAGTVVLKGVMHATDGTSRSQHSVTQTFIAGSSHFSMRGDRAERILVPLSPYARRVAESGRLVELRGLVLVKNGRRTTFSVHLVG